MYLENSGAGTADESYLANNLSGTPTTFSLSRVDDKTADLDGWVTSSKRGTAFRNAASSLWPVN